MRLYAGFPSADIFVIQTGIYVQDGFHENKRKREQDKSPQTKSPP
jgi:hypothetical protein